MMINIFSGARRIALIITIFGVVVGLVVGWIVHPSFSLITYSLSEPGAPLAKLEGDVLCPEHAATSLFHSSTSKGTDVLVTLCLLAREWTPVDSSDKTVAWVIPYKRDDQGVFLAAAEDSNAIENYEHHIEKSFKLPKSDDATLANEFFKERREYWLTFAGYLAAGVIGFWLLVWAIGWITRGFLGIPLGKDKRPD